MSWNANVHVVYIWFVCENKRENLIKKNKYTAEIIYHK